MNQINGPIQALIKDIEQAVKEATEAMVREAMEDQRRTGGDVMRRRMGVIGQRDVPMEMRGMYDVAQEWEQWQDVGEAALEKEE